MCQPLSAEGEFALLKDHLEIALSQPSIGWIAFGDHELYILLADAAARQRDEAALAQYLPLAEASAIRYEHRLFQAIAHRSRGVAHHLAGEFPEAEFQLNQALDSFTAMEMRYQLGRTLYELGALAVTQLQADVARGRFTRSFEEFRSLEAVTDMVLVRAALDRLI